MEALGKAKRPFVINSYGAIEADHYTTSFCVLNLRDPVVRDYWLTAWGRLYSEVGIAGIFLDSSFNMSSDKFDWRFNADPEAATGSATIDQTHLLEAMRPARTPPSSIETQDLRPSRPRALDAAARLRLLQRGLWCLRSAS